MSKHLSKLFSAVLILMLMLSAFPMQTAQAVSPDIVISQVYGGGETVVQRLQTISLSCSIEELRLFQWQDGLYNMRLHLVLHGR